MPTTTLYAIKDCYFTSSNFNLTTLQIGAYSAINNRAFIDFAFSSIPSAATVTSATLTLSRESGATTTTDFTIDIITNSWVETAVTSSNYTSYSINDDYRVVQSNSSGDLVATVTSAVNFCVRNPYKNGFYISNNGLGKTFYSSEYSTETDRPKLVVEWTAPPTFSSTTVTTSPSGTYIPKSTNSITVSWTAATGYKSETIRYEVTPYINGVAQTAISNLSSTSYSHNVSGGAAGTQYYYKIRAYDSEYSTYIQSSTLTKNTLPTWTNSNTPSVNGFTTNTIISESTTSLSITDYAGSANSGGTISYEIYEKVNGGAATKIATVSTVPYSRNISSGAQGTTYQYIIYLYDGLDYATTVKTSAIITKNNFTPATLTASQSILYGASATKYNAPITWSGASNTMPGATISAYYLSSNTAGVDIRNSTVSMGTGSSYNLEIYKTGTLPTGPYIEFSQLKTKYQSTGYKGTLSLKLSTKNSNNTTEDISTNVTVDITTDPVGLSAPTIGSSSYYTINSVQYYIPNRKAISLTWDPATDPLGGLISYDLQVSLNSGAYQNVTPSLSTTSSTYSVGVSSATTCKFRVVARASYGNYLIGAESGLIILHYWNPPTISLSVFERTMTGFKFTGTITQGTTSASALNNDYTVPRFYSLDGGAPIVGTPYPVTEISLSGNSSAVLEVGYRNWGYYGIISTTAYVSTDTVIPKFAPMFSIRESGVAVNKVADGGGIGQPYIFEVNGNANFIGDDIYLNGTPISGGGSASILVASETSDTTGFPIFVIDQTGSLGPKTNPGLKFNASTSELFSTIVRTETLKLNLPALSNGLLLKPEINESFSANRTLYFAVNEGDRTIDLYGNLIINGSISFPSGVVAGDILYADGTGTMQRLPKPATTSYLRETSTGSISWSQIPESEITFTDITTNNASITKHGYLLKAVIPQLGLLNIVGIGNGESSYGLKPLFDTTAPSTQAFGDSASTGVEMVAARRDHKHAMPADPTPALTTLINGKENYHGIESIGALSFSNSLHTLSFTGVTYWYQGVEYTSAGAISCDLDLTTDRDNSSNTLTSRKLYFFYFKDSTGKLYWSDVFWNLKTMVPVATVYWNGTAGALSRETHGYTRDLDWHIWAHTTTGARYLSGLDLIAPTSGSPSTLSIGSGSLADEDLTISISSQSTCRFYYKFDANNYTFVDYSYPYGGVVAVPQYLDTDTYALTTLGAGRLGCYWVFATADVDKPIAVIPTHASEGYTTIAQARAELAPSISGVNPEWKLIHRYIYNANGVFQESTDYRLQTSLAGGVSASTTASAVNFSPSGNISSTTVQTALEELDSEKANITLSNLGTTAINTSLISDADNTDDLGSLAKAWNNTYSNKVFTTAIAPHSDGVTALQFMKANGTSAIVTLDTTNDRLGIGTSNPSYKLDVSGDMRADDVSVTNTLKVGGKDAAVGYYYVVGNTSGTAGTWTGTAAGLTSYYAGLTIAYKIGIAGASTTTLNINGLGAITCKYNDSNLTTHLGVNTVVILTYDGTYFRWADYAYSDLYELRNNYYELVGSDPIYSYKILAEGTDGALYPLTLESGTGLTKTVSTRNLKIGGKIKGYITTATITAGTLSRYYFGNVAHLDGLYTFNSSSGFVAGKPIYIVGIPQSDGSFKLDNSSYTSFYTQTLPTTEDGKIYIYLGTMHDTSRNIRVEPEHTIFEYRNGSIRPYVSIQQDIENTKLFAIAMAIALG